VDVAFGHRGVRGRDSTWNDGKPCAKLFVLKILLLEKMETHFELSDTKFENQFSTCSLDSKIFTHEAHLRLAWIHIHKYGVDIAIENITTQLQNFVEALGAKDKFNMTLTISAIRAVYHFMLKSKTNNFQAFISENPRLKNNFRELLSYHYKTDIFKSEKAKIEYLEPELLPFD